MRRSHERFHGKAYGPFLTALLLLPHGGTTDRPTPQADGALASTEITGCWYAEPQFEGQAGHVAITFARGEGDVLSASLSLLDIDVYEVPAGKVSRNGDEVRIGTFSLRYDPRANTLSTVLPAFLVPVHSIPATFHRIPELPRPVTEPAPIATAAPVWSFATGGSVWAGLTATGETVYAGSDDGCVYALDAQTGQPRWRFATGGPVRARCTVEADLVVVQSDDGFLYCLSARDGALAWRVQLDDEPEVRHEFGDPEYRYDNFASAATIVAGTVFVGCADGSLYARDLATGAERWRFATNDVVTSDPAVADGRVFVGSFDGNVYALDAASGALLWTHDTGGPIPSTPAVLGDLVIVGSRSYDLLGLRAADGGTAWRHYCWFSWIESSVTLRDGVAYVGSSDAQQLHALQADRGTVLWQFDTGGSAWARPAVTDDRVFIGAVGVADYVVDHRAAFVAVDRATGTGAWRFAMERSSDELLWGFASSPAAAGGRVFVGALDGRVLAFDQLQKP